MKHLLVRTTHSGHFRLSATAQACLCLALGSGLYGHGATSWAQAQAQAQPQAQPQAPAGAETAPAQQVTVTGNRSRQPVSAAGFGDVPLSQLPLSATVITRSQLADAGIASLADITRLDADITDAYNAPGYINQLAVRGFTLDNRFNYRRDGLPINAETVIGQANKQALEVIKGTSGLQAGTSAPAGLVNLVVKRPSSRVMEASLAWVQPGTWDMAVDVGNRSAADGHFGWRVNAQSGKIDPSTRSAQGERHLGALALDARVSSGLLELELETSRQSQPSTPGFSLLGDAVPDARRIDPRINLNNQAWSLPVVFTGNTGSIRWTQAIGADSELQVHALQQRLRTDDRIAFPYGCSSENRYDRYCSDGSFDLYDFRSEGERRTTRALQLKLSTKLALGSTRHELSLGWLGSQLQARFGRQAFNWVGVGQVDGAAVVPADASLTDENTQRDERSSEWFVQSASQLSEQLSLWSGLRITRLQRDSVRTDGSRATAYSQSFSVPWLAASWKPSKASALMLYGSWGQGVESEVAPKRARYVNAGQALPALKSQQTELGVRHQSGAVQWRAAFFDIRRPVWSDVLLSTQQVAPDYCADADPCRRLADGSARHRGLEAEAETRLGPLSLRASALWLRAQRNGSVDASLNGLKPTNVPSRSLKAQAAWNVAQLPGLSLLAFASHEGQRKVLPDNSVATPGWTRWDLGVRWAQNWQGHSWVWRGGVDNLTDHRAWQESPFQYGHAYLYPMAPRTWRASVEARF